MNNFRNATVRAFWLFAKLALLSLWLSASARAQYTDSQAIDDLGGPNAFAARRAELAKQVKTGWALLFARNEIPESTHYREDNDFYYFTGLQDPGAVMALDAEKGVTYIFEPQQLPRTAKVYGPNLLSLSEADRTALGFPLVLPITQLDQALSSFLAGPGSASPASDLWVRLNFTEKAEGARQKVARDISGKFSHPYPEPVPDNLAPTYLLAQRYPMLHLRDVTPILPAMPTIKHSDDI